MTDWERVLEVLRAAGVAGVEDFGTFVNDTTYFAPSAFDVAAATPVLIELLPGLTDPSTVKTVVMHLQNRRARQKDLRDQAYRATLDVFETWAPKAAAAGWPSKLPSLAWQAAGTLVWLADRSNAAELLAMAADGSLAEARQLIVDSLWRFRSVVDVVPALESLSRDPTVALHAMSALRRCLAPEDAVTFLESLLAEDLPPTIHSQASEQIKRIRRAQQKRAGGSVTGGPTARISPQDRIRSRGPH